MHHYALLTVESQYNNNDDVDYGPECMLAEPLVCAC